MRIFQTYRFKDAKKPSAPERLERAISLLRDRGWAGYDARFYFEHTICANTTGKSYRPVDACARLVKRYPEMHQYYSVHQLLPPRARAASCRT